MVHKDVSIFGLTFDLSPVAFTIPGTNWNVYWYGIAIALGFLLALVYGLKNARRLGVDPDRMIDVVLVSTPVAIICARLYFIIFDKDSSLKDLIDFSDGGFRGLAIYGGIIGAFLCGLLMCKLRKIKVLNMFDLAGIGFLIGQGIGRWGNFFNQEAFGSNTTLPWGMTSSTVREYLESTQEALAAIGVRVDPEMPVHPCFLYEFLWCMLGFVLLHLLSKHRKFSGQIILGYCMWYGVGRFFIESLRVDSLMIGDDIRVSKWLSLIIAIGAAVIMLAVLKSIRKKESAGEYTSVFGEGEINEFLEENSGETNGDAEAETDASESGAAETKQSAGDVSDGAQPEPEPESEATPEKEENGNDN